MNRLELLAESLRAALNELAVVAPEWLRGVAPAAWYERYGRRVEESRLPGKGPQREAYAEAVGRDGFTLLDRLDAPEAPVELRALPQVQILHSLRQRHFERGAPPDGGGVRMRPEGQSPPTAEAIESP